MRSFKGPSRRGTTPAPVTPYQKAAQLWDERMGAARVQARNWRLMAFGCLLLASAATAGLLIQAGSSRVTPYVIEVASTGEVRAVGAAAVSYDPTDAQIARHIGHFIELIRSLSSDPVIVRRNWLNAYELVTDRAANRLNAYAQENDPFASVGRVSVTVALISVVRISDMSFEARWRERRFENGAPQGDDSYTGVFTLIQEPPRTEAALMANPLGLYVHDLDWTKDFTGEPK